MNKEHSPRYKRGSITKNGKLYGYSPNGSLYRIYNTDRPLLQMVDINGETFLRIRVATEKGYVDCPPFGVFDISYPSSALRRSRIIDGGKVSKTLLTSGGNLCVFIEL